MTVKRNRKRWCMLWMLLLPLAAQALDVVVTYVGPKETSAHLGALQGLAEANAQGEFLGVTFHLLPPDTDGPAVPVAIIAAVNSTRLVTLAEQNSDRPILNISARETELREGCYEGLFHIPPSAAMLEDAERQWQRKSPGSPAKAQAWHETFRKYAAAQLNIRFREQFERDMDDDAWAGWAAMRLLADTIVRQPNIAGEELRHELTTNLAFDGQKGSDMSFRDTGQLRQPLLLVDGDKIVGEAPVRGVVSTTNLDSLGIAKCPK